jgi:hypothetical protein
LALQCHAVTCVPPDRRLKLDTSSIADPSHSFILEDSQPRQTGEMPDLGQKRITTSGTRLMRRLNMTSEAAFQ